MLKSSLYAGQPLSQMNCGVQISAFGDIGCAPSHQLSNPWSLCIDSEGVIVANDCDNRRVLLLRLDDDQLVHLGDLLSVYGDLPETFYPRRICLGDGGLVYVGSGLSAADSGVAAETSRRTVGSVTVWDVLNSASV